VKRLTLVRHAQAGSGTGAMTDADRPLDPRGEDDAREMAASLVAARLVPTLMITSPAVRARATARIFADPFGCAADRIRLAPEAYLAPASELLDLMRRLGGRARHVMLFGHNPGISRFAGLLAKEPVPYELPACAAISLLAPVGNWGELQIGQAATDFYQSPKNRP
jgi:phosphohistidine phosphatase